MSRSGWGLITSAVLLATGSSAQHDVPTPENFLRRLAGRSVVLGDYIYFDGGELSERGFNVTGRLTNPANATLSIDLTKSWSPSSVEINETPRGDDNRVLVRQHILQDNSSNTFYIWGGGSNWGQSLQNPAVLWKFTANGEGGGAWSEETDLTNRARFEDLDRTAGGAYASTPNKGFIFGGSSGDSTDPSPPANNPSGYVKFDFEAKEWSRDTRGPYTDSGALFGATATFVPNFGPNGVIVILGGVSQDRATDYLDFRTIHFIDPVTEKWFTQGTSGDAPDARATHCSAGVSGNNGTFEIFVYGGEIRHSYQTKRDMYALSLPGFRWTRLPVDDGTERRDHSCSVVGKRQMLSWGGLNSTGSNEDHWNPQDPLPMGIGIFDLTEWEWKESYDADAETYRTHNTIMSWYNNGGMNTVDWSSDEVKTLFTTQESGTPPEEGAGGDDDEKDKNGGGGGISGGTIAGAVIGAIGGLALGAGLAWFFFRRRRNKTAANTPGTSDMPGTSAAELEQHNAPPSNSTTPKPYGSGQTYYSESYSTPGAYAPIPQQPTSELMATNPPVEMADTSRPRY